MKVLVTGGSGFIGKNLVEEYLNKDYEVIVVDIQESTEHQNLNQNSRYTFYNIDVVSSEFIELVNKEKPDIINHHAAQIDVQQSIKNPKFDADVNILGTINVLEACKQVKAGIIYPSSAAIYGMPEYLGVDENHPTAPISFYGISKFTPEAYIRVYNTLYGIPFTIMRYANAYGKYQDPKGEGGVISILVNSVTKNKPFTIFGDGEQTRDFIHIDDIVNANIKATKNPINDIINIGTEIATSLQETIALFEKISNVDINITYEDDRKGDIKHSFLTNSKASKLLNWEPMISLENGINKTIEYYKS